MSATIEEKGQNMPLKVFINTASARNREYQDSLLASVVPNWPNVPMYFDEEGRGLLSRATRRQETDEIYTASLAVLADNETSLVAFVGAVKLKGSVIKCIEEGITIDKTTKIPFLRTEWKEARRRGASMRGARKSAVQRRAATAARLEAIRQELESSDAPTRQLLDKVGIRSINTIKNHFGFCREEMKRKYQQAQKRKERRNAKAN